MENEGLSEYDKNSIQIDIEYSEEDPLAIPNGFPKGSNIGSALHEVFEKTDFANYNNDSLKKLITDRFDYYALSKDEENINYVVSMVDNVLKADLPVIKGNSGIKGQFFKLNELTKDNKKPEIEFNTNVLDGRLKNYFNGFIDLLFKRGEVYSVLDWKSDSLNDGDFANYYSKEELKRHTDNAYSIQRVLYCYFLIEWLTLQYGNDKEKIFNEHFGGIYYVYLRGCKEDTSNGVYSQTWSSYKDLESAFNNIINKFMGGNR